MKVVVLRSRRLKAGSREEEQHSRAVRTCVMPGKSRYPDGGWEFEEGLPKEIHEINAVTERVTVCITSGDTYCYCNSMGVTG